MSEKHWIPPAELEPEPRQSRKADEVVPPTVLAEEGEAQFDAYVREGQQPDAGVEAMATNGQVEALEREMRQRRRRPLRWLLGSAGALLAGVVTLDSYTFLEAVFEHSLILGILFTALITLLVVSVLVIAYQQLRAVRSLRDIAQMKQEAERLHQVDGYGSGVALTTRLSALYRNRQDVEPGLADFRTTVSDAHSDAEVLELFARHVLRPLDERATRIVTNYACQTALLTAVSPLALLDASLSLWRNVAMARAIASLYGGHPGAFGTLTLMRAIVGNLAAASASDVIADAGAEAFGGTLAATLSAKVGQGMAMGLFTIRVGLTAIRLCRPMAFQEREGPRIRDIRGEIVRTLRQALSGSG